MADVSMRLTGDRELAAKFRRMSTAMRGEALVTALRAGAQPVVNDAKRRAPVDTGTLRRSIHAGDERSSGERAEIKVGTDVEYAIYPEFGTRYMAARPYLRPALESQQGAARNDTAAALRDVLRRAVG